MGQDEPPGVRVIRVVEPDPRWPVRFGELGRRLRQALGDVAVRIDHIGSTAVPGLAAKPVVDIQISVASLEPVEPFRVPLEGLGYVHRAGNPERTKRYFREPPGEPRTHIHVRRAGSFSEQFPLLFRDYLREDREAAEQYAAVKRRLAAEHPHDGHAYTDAKAAHCRLIIQRADEWAQTTGRSPGPGDACGRRTAEQGSPRSSRPPKQKAQPGGGPREIGTGPARIWHASHRPGRANPAALTQPDQTQASQTQPDQTRAGVARADQTRAGVDHLTHAHTPTTGAQACGTGRAALIAEHWTVTEEIRRRRRSNKRKAGKAPQQVLTGHDKDPRSVTTQPSPRRSSATPSQTVEPTRT